MIRLSASESVSYAVSGLRQDRRSRYGPLANMVEITETQQNIDQVRRGQALGDGEPDNLLAAGSSIAVSS